ncbi:Inositol hexakisphosphate kinase 1 [Phlyctema vagabunda]|uniref:Kinase n=1 Tax=Phlyctema vagabunda TaxID=108571 RepID=A0ABR4PDN1_9HELO
MSSPPPEPEHAAITAPVKHEHEHDRGHQISRHGDPNKNRPSVSPLVSHSTSTSLLTQAFAASRDAPAAETSNAPDIAASATSTSSTQNPTPRDQQRHGPNLLERPDDPAADMASTMTEPARAPGATFGMGDTTLDAMNLNLSDMNDINQMLQSHRDSMNGSRGRGTSLERTEKERRLPALPKGSSNSGDTGFNTPPAPPSPTTLNSIASTPPTDGVRARYRSWRDARPGMGAEKAWSIGKQGTGDGQGGQVEKSITEAMTGVEPNNRSRKASHSLRFFREGLPEDKQKKTDKKGKGSRTSSYRGKDGTTGEKDEGMTATPPILEEPAVDLEPTRSPTASYFDISAEQQQELESAEMKSMPPQLLAEIRRHHNLTPGASKGSSFSRSIPVPASERKNVARGDGDVSSPEKISTTIDPPTHDEDTAGSNSPIKSGDDEDSGEEQISSALFVPHKTPHESPENERDSFAYGAKADHSRSDDLPRADDSDSNTQQWLEEHEVPSADIEAKYFSDEAGPQTPVPSTSINPPSQPIERSSLPSDIPAVKDTQREPREESRHTNKGEEVNLADDGEITPTGSPKHDRPVPKEVLQVHDHQEKSKQPLEAIELIPYRHQVGGHTTMWRFSKRAVCKQLNNRENEFYEKVERYHPHLLKFLPRYIGVLNVTFEKQQRRKSTRKEASDSNLEKGPDAGVSSAEEKTKDGTVNLASPDASAASGEERPRMISQSMHSSSVPIPTVTFADNRHIIPTSFLQPHPHLVDPQHRSKSDISVLPATTRRSLAQSQPPLPESDFTFRPTLTDKHAVSWGATTVNKQLRNQVFGEAFLQNPIPIHRNKKPGSQTRSLPQRHGSTLRPSISESALKSPTEPTSAQQPEESMRRKAMKTAAERRTSTTGPLAMTPMSPEKVGTDVDGTADAIADDDFDGRAGTSAPEQEIGYTQQHSTTRPRRYSSGGLRRKPTEVAESRGNLKYFVEADDAGYKGDEEDVFTMDPEPTQSKPSQSPEDGVKEALPLPEVKDVVKDASPTLGTMLPAAPAAPSTLLNIPRPVNPTTARTLRDQRVEYFLLLEDLTAGMKKPCIMDLKMGTRQYGVEANEKKQKSQRKKCAETTSKELGVRVCGLQVWDVKTQAYIFQDKYFGRDLKVGTEFQDALMRFLYDGVDYSSVLRHIPTILKKLSQLEVLIRGLEGYRFYAASLLMFYDGDTQHEYESDSTAGEREVNETNKAKEIDFKIADFANCVTKEGMNINERPCPPRHPGLPDRGFLRGLRSLKSYFLAIQKDIRRKEKMGTRRTAVDDDDGFEIINEANEDDEDGISY